MVKMKVHEIEFSVFCECIYHHPRFNELYDVLPVILEFLNPALNAFEREFQNYLDSLRVGNIMVWLYHMYGDKRKFHVKPSLLRKRRSYNLVSNPNSIPYLVQMLPYMFYFPSVISGVEKQPGHVFENGRWVGLGQMGHLVFPFIELRITIRVDGWWLHSRSAFYSNDENGEYVLTPRNYIRKLKQLFENTVHGFRELLVFEFRLQNIPNRENFRPDFELRFSRNSFTPEFSVL